MATVHEGGYSKFEMKWDCRRKFFSQYEKSIDLGVKEKKWVNLF